MKRSTMLSIFLAGIFLFASCQETAKQETAATTVSTETAKPDLTKIRSEITDLENAWATAMNAKDINALMALYADNAVSMPDGEPMLNGKAAIQKKQEMDFAAPANFSSITFETLDVYAQGDVATEVGKTMYKDAAGKVTGSGKYIAVFEKQNGKYLCIREIYNKDSK